MPTIKLPNKAELTSIDVKPGTIVFLACDGLVDVALREFVELHGGTLVAGRLSDPMNAIRKSFADTIQVGEIQVGECSKQESSAA